MRQMNNDAPPAGAARQDRADVLFLYPPLHRLYGERKQWMPLSILYLTAYLNEHGISARAYNADCSLEEPECVMSYQDRFLSARNFQKNLNAGHAVWDEMAECLETVRPKIVGISVLTEALGSVKKTVGIIRRCLPDVFILAGGPHAEIDSQYLLDELGIDFVIKGDGEKSVCDLSRALLGGTPPEEALGARLAERVVHAERIDVAELPIPKLEYHYRYDRYRKVGRKLNVSTSRGGCVYACKFCYCSKYKYALRFRPPERVVEELAYYAGHYRTQKVFFVDDTFTMKRDYIIAICKLILQKGVSIGWTCTTRANQVDPELLAFMKRAGCRSIHIGVESGSPRLLELINKKISLADVLTASAQIRDAGIDCRLFFMAGLPTETPDDLRKTIELIRRIRPDETIMSMYVPIPGTPLYDLICAKYYPFDRLDWTTFSRDQLPYRAYIDDTDGTYDQVLQELYRLVEELNAQKG